MRDGTRAVLSAWLPPVGMMLAIFAASSVPGGSLPPGRLSVVGHIIEYSILALLLYRAVRLHSDATIAILLAVLGSSAYGLTDELHQAFVPGRSPDGWDWVVDTAAATGTMALVSLGNALRRKRPRAVQ